MAKISVMDSMANLSKTFPFATIFARQRHPVFAMIEEPLKLTPNIILGFACNYISVVFTVYIAVKFDER
jgi:hypothetical protein